MVLEKRDVIRPILLGVVGCCGNVSIIQVCYTTDRNF